MSHLVTFNSPVVPISHVRSQFPMRCSRWKAVPEPTNSYRTRVWSEEGAAPVLFDPVLVAPMLRRISVT